MSKENPKKKQNPRKNYRIFKMSTKIPWFRYGLKETKKWFKELRQSKSPCIGEVSDALDRCIKNNEKYYEEEMNEAMGIDIKSDGYFNGEKE